MTIAARAAGHAWSKTIQIQILKSLLHFVGLQYPGTELIVFHEESSKISVFNTASKREHVKRLSYRVRYGESLSLIANKFNISIKNIHSWNKGLSQRKYIHPGDRLTLYVDVTSQIN